MVATEKRLIDANAFVKHFERAKEIAKVIPGELGEIFQGLYDECIEEIKKQPTVDAVEVVHGRWELYPSDRSIKCTNCKMEFLLIHMPYTRNYCPNCGAKMS